MKTATMRNVITGETKRVHLTKDHPAAECGMAVWADDDGKAYFPEDVMNPFYELTDVRRAVDGTGGEEVGAGLESGE